ncbi:MAG: hypothetical protein AB7F89_27685, partial [Pirellulaceae bacterium]
MSGILTTLADGRRGLRRAGWVCIGCIGLSFGFGLADLPAQESRPRSLPLSPDEALGQLRLADDRLQVELVAVEPQVIDPVAAQFDENGRLWVVEMRDYPHGPPAGKEPQSQIKILQDQDGDGRFESMQVFADHLLFVTELLPWKGGAIVTLAGEVVYMKDTDGDGRADQRETWYRGFAQEN